MTSTPDISAIILAAGKGTRMNSDLPKVVHPVGGRPMIRAVVQACLAAGCARVVVVVGHMQHLVREALADLRCEFVEQREQLGTGHAVTFAAPLFRREAAEQGHRVLVLCGDGPLVRERTLRGLVDRHASADAAATLATAVVENPAGYGRIVRDRSGRFERIVEHKNANQAERAIREVNPSYYCFDAQALFAALPRLPRNSLTGEYYVTDVLALFLQDGWRVEVVEGVPPDDVLSINTPEDLARVDAIFRARLAPTGAAAGTGGVEGRGEVGGPRR